MRIRVPLLLLFAGLCCLGLTLGACSSDSPSEPQQTPAPTPPGTGPSNAAFQVTVTTDRTELRPFSGSDSALITVTVTDRNTGQAPPDGTVVTVTTTLGSFDPISINVREVLVELVNGTATLQLFTFFSSNDTGTALVQARLGSSVGSVQINIRSSSSLAISSVDPNTGDPGGGDEVVIRGTGFVEPVRVTFSGVAASVLSVSGERVRVRTPPLGQTLAPGTTQAVDVEVTVALNEPTEANDTLPSGFNYVLGGGSPTTPVIFSVTPQSGPNEGGTRVVITGQGFTAPVQVLFGQAQGNQFDGIEGTVESVTSTRIVVTSPSATGFAQNNQNEQVDIQVRNLGTGFSAVFLGGFRYGSSVIITAVVPDTVVYDSQTRVTIFGQGFDAPVDVQLAGIQATPLSVTGTEILVRPDIPLVTGCTDISGAVQVTNIDTGDSDSSTGGAGPQVGVFTYRVPQPTITGVSPNSALGAGGAPVTVNGVNFQDPARVLFGGIAGSVTSVAAAGTSISVMTPTFADFEEEACDDDGDGQQGMRFVPTAVDVEVFNLITGCSDLLSGGFTFTPSDVACRGDSGMTTPACSDGIDNDGDGFTDHASVNPVNPDPECSGPGDNDESM